MFLSTSQEVEQLRQEKLEIDQQLRAIQESSMGSTQSFAVSRRSERGYSSDIESVRSIRGGSGGQRGRGRGRGGGGNSQRYHTNRRDDDDYNSRGDHQREQRYNNDRGNVGPQNAGSSGGGGGGGSGGGGGGNNYRGGNDRRGVNRRPPRNEQNGRDYQYHNHTEEMREAREVSSVERGESMD